MSKLSSIFQLFLVFSSISFSISGQEIIFPGLKGGSLFTELKRYYAPKTVLPYDQARIKLYTEIFLENDTIECFYSRYKVPITDKTKVLSLTAKLGIQTEHLFPRSIGALSLPALGDLHHLVPARATINTLRKNAPCQDIPDDQPKYWLYKDKVLTTIPRKEIHLYSESKSNAFEPLEFRKGEIARAMFYFYTFYRSEADQKSKSYFSSMLLDLCQWHRSDKVDSTEINRTLAIARIQSNVNPFIFDPSLAERCYCKAYPSISEKAYTVNIYPNPSKGLFYINIPDYKGQIIMKISNQSDKLLEIHHLMYSGLMSWRLGKGIYKIEIGIESRVTLIQAFLII
ncbi:MAG: endonuclease [Saprospiraceae bacterium]|nr:endonuclease [Saprospiraceae bacterium]